MTERVVERDARTACRSTSTPSTGDPALMPPHSQGAERRREHRAGRRGSRWGLRALVIGGLAGAAWLLAGVAAQAADRGPAGEGLLGSVLNSEHSIPVVDRIPRAAAQPPASEDHRVTSVAELPSELPETPAPAEIDSIIRESTSVTDVHEPVAHRSGQDPAGAARTVAGPVGLVHLGAANGVPASGPGRATEGGSAAFRPAGVADGTVARHRLPIVADVEARRHDAEAPTVSPD